MVAILLLVIAAAAVVAGITTMRASMKARAWPVVTGRIIQRTVGPSTTTGASRAGRYFEPRVTYDYIVDGTTYTGHRISLTTKAYDEDKARRVANKLPDNVTVHYNPGDASDAVLQPSAITTSIALVVGGTIGLLIGAGMLFTRIA